MKDLTRKKFDKLHKAMCLTYGVDSTRRLFSVQEPVEVILHGAIQDSIDFLEHISFLPVTDIQGQSIEVGLYSPLARRTNTSNKDRQCTPVSPPDGLQYQCHLTEFDIHFSYDLLNAWSRFDNFMELYSYQVQRQIALDRILVGFMGTHTADETDPDTYPDRQDVNVGWLQLMRDHMPEQYMTESSEGSGKITLGRFGDYRTLDEMAWDLYSIIDERFRNGNEVAIVGQHLLAWYMSRSLSDFGHIPSEKNCFGQGMVEALMSSLGTLPMIQVPGFPSYGLMITDPKNLVLHYQSGSTRRKMVDNAKRNRVEDFISVNDAYMIGNLAGVAAIESDNVEVIDSLEEAA